MSSRAQGPQQLQVCIAFFAGRALICEFFAGRSCRGVANKTVEDVIVNVFVSQSIAIVVSLLPVGAEKVSYARAACAAADRDPRLTFG